MDERLPWFPCEPGPLLGALAGMRAPKQLVYLVMLLRIYECGGACPDTIEAISNRTRLNKRVVTEALDDLFREGRLFSGEGGIRNPKADRVMEDAKSLRKKRKIASSKAGLASVEKRKENQQTDPTKRSPDVDQPSTHLHLHLQEQEQEQKKEESKSSGARKRGARLADDWVPDRADLHAAEAKLGQASTLEELAKFRDYWKAQPGQRAVKLDWDATWRNWIRNAKGLQNGKASNSLGGFSGLSARLKRTTSDADLWPDLDAGGGQPPHGR